MQQEAALHLETHQDPRLLNPHLECEFVNVELKTSLPNNNNMTQGLGVNEEQQQQRRCLVDLTNFNNVNVVGNSNANN